MSGGWRLWHRWRAARRLSGYARREAGPPPADLLRRLREDIRERQDLPGRSAAAAEPGRARLVPGGGQRRWLVAAALAVAVTGGLVGLRVRERLPVSQFAAARRPDAATARRRQIAAPLPPVAAAAAPAAGSAPATARPHAEDPLASPDSVVMPGVPGASDAPQALAGRSYQLAAPDGSPLPAERQELKEGRVVPGGARDRQRSAAVPGGVSAAGRSNTESAAEAPDDTRRVAAEERQGLSKVRAADVPRQPPAPAQAKPANAVAAPSRFAPPSPAAPPVQPPPPSPSQSEPSLVLRAEAERQEPAGAASAGPSAATSGAGAPAADSGADLQAAGFSSGARAAGTKARARTAAKVSPPTSGHAEAGEPAAIPASPSAWSAPASPSSFGADTGTDSYRGVRRVLLAKGRLPRAAAVQVEELANAFDMAGPAAALGRPELIVEGAPLPQAAATLLLRFAVHGLVGAPGRDAVEVDFDPAVVARFRRVGATAQRGGATALFEVELRQGIAAAPASARAMRLPESPASSGPPEARPSATSPMSLEMPEPLGTPRTAPALKAAQRDGDLVVATLRLSRVGGAAAGAAELRVRLSSLRPSWQAASPALRLPGLAVQLAEALAAGRPPARLQELRGQAEALAAELPGDPKAAELLRLVQRAADLAGAPAGTGAPRPPSP